MFFRRWDPGSQGLKRNQSDLYHDDKIGRICRRKGISETWVILVLRRILWVGEKIGIEGSVSSLGSSKWMWNPEDQSQDYQGMILVIIKTVSFSFDKEIMDKLKTEDKIGRRWVIFGLADLINPISSLSKFRSDFTCYLFLVVLSMWVGDPYKVMDWSKNRIFGYVFLCLVLTNHYGHWYILFRIGLYWCLVICWRRSGRIGIGWVNWSSLIYFPVLFTALLILILVSSNQLQRRDTDMEATRRCFLKGIQVDVRVVPRMAVESYLLFSIICLSWVKRVLATFVAFLDKGNRFSDGKMIIIGSEFGLINGYKCIIVSSGLQVSSVATYWGLLLLCMKGERIIIGNITKFLELFLHKEWWCEILLGIGDFMFGFTVVAMNIFLCSFGTGSYCHSSLLINVCTVVLIMIGNKIDSPGSYSGYIMDLSRLYNQWFSVIIKTFEMDVESR
ncbi:unnamed protein product [Brassica oleracea var. botrytis]